MSDRMPRASGYFRTGYAQEMALTKTRLERVSLFAFIALLLVYPYLASAFYLDLANQVFLACIGALSLIASLPVFVVVAVAQRYLVRGLSLGAVKG